MHDLRPVALGVLLASLTACSSATSTEGAVSSDQEVVTSIKGCYCEAPVFDDAHSVFANDCHAEGGPRIVRIDATNGAITTVAKTQPVGMGIVGGRLFYLEARTDSFAVHTHEIADLSKHEVTEFPGPVPVLTNYEFSSDGKIFVGWHRIDDTGAPVRPANGIYPATVRAELLIGRLDGSHVTKSLELPSFPGTHFGGLRAFWSADSSRVVLQMSRYRGTNAGLSFMQGTSVLRLDGDPELRLLNSWPSYVSELVRGPGNQSTFQSQDLYVSYYPYENDRSLVAHIDVDADVREEIVEGARNASLVLDGTKLYFAKPAEGAPKSNPGFADEIAVLDTSTKSKATVLPLDTDYPAPSFALTPDGKHLMFVLKHPYAAWGGYGRFGHVDTATGEVKVLGVSTIDRTLPNAGLFLTKEGTFTFVHLDGTVEKTGVSLNYQYFVDFDTATSNAFFTADEKYNVYDHASGNVDSLKVPPYAFFLGRIDGGIDAVFAAKHYVSPKESTYDVVLAKF